MVEQRWIFSRTWTGENDAGSSKWIMIRQRLLRGRDNSKAGYSMDRIAEISEERMKKYLNTTAKAIEKVEIAPPPRSHLKKLAEDTLAMAMSYFMDAKVFARDGNYVLAYGAVNYAHGWLDAGARMGLFDVEEDDQLFTLAE